MFRCLVLSCCFVCWGKGVCLVLCVFCSFLFVEVRVYVWCLVLFHCFVGWGKGIRLLLCHGLFIFVCWSKGISLGALSSSAQFCLFGWDLFGGRGIVLIRKLLQDLFSPMFSVFGYGYCHCFIIALLLLCYCFTHSLVSGEGEWATVLFFSEAKEASR